jgi:hypothetical protein
MNQWGQSCQAANQSLRTAIDAMDDLMTCFQRDIDGRSRISSVMTCFQRDIDGRSRISSETTMQLGDSLYALNDALQKLTASVGGVADAHSRALLSFLAGRRLDTGQATVLYPARHGVH